MVVIASPALDIAAFCVRSAINSALILSSGAFDAWSSQVQAWLFVLTAYVVALPKLATMVQTSVVCVFIRL